MDKDNKDIKGLIVSERQDTVTGHKFSDNQGDIELEIPEGIRAIGAGAFLDCKNLTSIKFPEGLEEIGRFAFGGCENLTEISVPSSVKEIGPWAFSNCSSLRELTLPHTFKAHDFALLLGGCTSLEKVTTGPAYEQKEGLIWDRETKELVLALPKAVINGKLTIPEPVTGFKEEALHLCTKTRILVLPNSLKRINGDDLLDLRRLHKIEIAEGGDMRTDGTAIYCGDRLVLCIAPKDDARKVVIPKGISKIDANAFSCYGDVLEEVEILDEGDSVFEIGDSAFEWSGNDNDGRIEFKKLTFKKKRLCSIGESAFRNCNKLKRFDNAVCVSIGESGFEMCETLSEAPIGEGTTCVGDSAFSTCSKIKKLTLPIGLKSTSWGSFDNLTALTHLSLNDDLEVIGTHSFAFCKKLRHVKLPNDLRKIETNAFARCGLESVCIPDNVAEVQAGAFGGCIELKEVKLPSIFIDSADEIFAGCEKLKKVCTSDGREFKFPLNKGNKEKQDKDHVANKPLIPNGQGYVEACEFQGRKDIREATIPDGVKVICSCAFEMCTNLAMVKLPEGLEVIEEFAFAGCKKLTRLNIPSSVKEIYDNAFCDCPKLKELTLPNGFRAEDFSFITGCKSLEKVTTGPEYEQENGIIWDRETKELMFVLPQAIKNGRLTIPEPVAGFRRDALDLCAKVTHISLPKTLKSISGYDLKCMGELRKIEIAEGAELRTDGTTIYCGNRLVLSITPEGDARKFVIPKGINQIAPMAFACYNDSLEEVEIMDDGDSVFEIGDSAFKWCSDIPCGRKGLKRIFFRAKKLCAIGDEAFHWCKNFEKVANTELVGIGTQSFACTKLHEANIGTGTSMIGDEAFSGCKNLFEIHLNDDLEVIGELAFDGCKAIKWIDLPHQLRKIGEYAFSGCGLESVSIPESVVEIGDGAFAFCKKLKEATLPSRFLDQKHDIFSHCNKLKKVIVSDEKLD